MFRTFKQRLAENELTPLFALSRIPHPVLIDMFGLAGGYAGFWLDGEHVAMTNEQMVNASIAARANNFDTFVRIPPIGYWTVTQCLEAGAGGVMAAQIHTVDQAREFVSWCKFAPEGVPTILITHLRVLWSIRIERTLSASKSRRLAPSTTRMRLRPCRASTCCLLVQPIYHWRWASSATFTTTSSGRRSITSLRPAVIMERLGAASRQTPPSPTGQSKPDVSCPRSATTYSQCVEASLRFSPLLTATLRSEPAAYMQWLQIQSRSFCILRFVSILF